MTERTGKPGRKNRQEINAKMSLPLIQREHGMALKGTPAASLLRVELQYLEDLLYAAKTRLICKMTQDTYHHEHSDRIQQCTENLDDQNVDI